MASEITLSLEKLSDDSIYLVLDCLSTQDQCRLMRCSKPLHSLINDEQFAAKIKLVQQKYKKAYKIAAETEATEMFARSKLYKMSPTNRPPSPKTTTPEKPELKQMPSVEEGEEGDQ
ncbi:MAG TPA: F-box protein [Rhabdochlamydiaceae bacterium]|nr:F-box protein [Rhabdochlamydiaceae bacterium]